MASGPITSWQIDGETVETVSDFIFGGSKITEDGDCSHEIETLAPWKKSYDQSRQCIKKQRHYFVVKSPSSQSYGFSSGPVQVWEHGHKEGWALKNWHFLIVVLEKTLESPLDSKEIKPVNPKGTVNPKGNQPWIFIGRTDTEAEAPILWPPDAKSQLFGKDLMLGKIEGRRRRGWQRIKWLDTITHSIDMNLSKLWEIVKDRWAWPVAVHKVTNSQTWLSNWTTRTKIFLIT